MRYIEHIDQMDSYAPPGHSGTRNVRLVDPDFCGRFEMVLGEIEPGGVADRHHHDVQAQAVYILDGEAEVALGDGAPERCGPGTVVRIPPKMDHEVRSVGARSLRLIVLYSPPLNAPAADPG